MLFFQLCWCMMIKNKIHQTAIVSDSAVLSEGVEIGPYCIIGDNVKLGKNVKLYSNVCIDGNTSIGEATQIFPFVTIGYVPQDLKYNGEHSKVIIGTNNTIREHVTIHLGTQKGGMLTKIGNNCLLMVGSHIATCRGRASG